jgi:hypothetical protein
MGMKTIAGMAAKWLSRLLTKDFRELYGAGHGDRAERLGAFARSTVECLGRSDALYHNLEHTMLVTLVGRDILHGRMMCERVAPDDYHNLITACLLHDIGYVRGVLQGDSETEYVVDQSGRKVTLPRGASDASLAPYHIERSLLFVQERLGKSPSVDADRVARAIEFTRFPTPVSRVGEDVDREPRLVQAADLIGQLGDPLYPRKANALFYEFEEIGANRQLGYSSPADLIEKYPGFFWNSVAMHLGEATTYLNLTARGRQWIANLHHHVMSAEHAFRFMGPQR